MSLHQINLQKDVFRSKLPIGSSPQQDREDAKASPPTPFVVTIPSTAMIPGSFANLSSPFRQTEYECDDGGGEDDDDEDMIGLSDVASQYSQKSWWAEISEVDSMAASRKSSAMSIASMVSDDDENEDEERKNDETMMIEDEDPPREDGSSPLGDRIVASEGRAQTTPKIHNHGSNSNSNRRLHYADDSYDVHEEDDEDNIVKPRGVLQGIREDHQSCGDSTVEEGSVASVYDRSSLGSTSGGNMRKTSSKQRYQVMLKEAEWQAMQARQELEIVQRQLTTLQQRQRTELDDVNREMVRQQSMEHTLRMELKSNEVEYKMVRDRLMDAVRENRSLTATIQEQEAALTMQAQEHEQTVQDLEAQLRTAEQAKATAEAKLEEALEKVDALQKELAAAATAKAVRFAEENNEVVVFRSTDYANSLQHSQTETHVLSSQLKSLQLDLESLQEENASLKTLQNDSKISHLQELKTEKETAHQARSQVRDLLSSLVEMQQNSERVEKERLDLEAQLQEAHDGRDQTLGKLHKKEKDLKRVEQEVRKINRAIASLQQGESVRVAPNNDNAGENLFYELEKARFRLEKQATIIQEERKTLQDAVNNATNQYNSISDQLVVMELEKKELMQQLDDLKRAATALRQENKRITDEKVHMEQTLAEQLALMATSQVRVQELEMERATIQEELSLLRQTQADTQKSYVDSETLESVSKAETSTQIDVFKANLVRAEQDLEKERELLRERVEHCHHLESQLKQIRQELDQAKMDKVSAAESHAREMENHMNATRAAQAKAVNAQEQLEELQKHQTDTQRQIAELADARASLQKQLQEINDQLWFAQQENEHLKTRVTALDVALEEAREVAKCNASTNVFALQRNTLQMQLHEKEAFVKDLEEKVHRTESESIEKDQQIRNLQAVEGALNEHIHSLREDLREAQSALEEAQAKIAFLETENSALQTSLSAVKQSLQELEQSKKRIEAEKDSMETAHKQICSQLQGENEVALCRVSQLENERTHLEMSLQALSTARVKFQSEADEANELWKEAKEQFRFKNKEFEAARRDAEKHQRENVSLREQIESINLEQSNAMIKFEESLEQIEELRQEVQLTGQRNNDLQRINTESEETISTLKTRLIHLNEEKERMIVEHEASEQEIYSSRATMDELRKENGCLKTQLGLMAETLAESEREKGDAVKEASLMRSERDRVVLAELGLHRLTEALEAKADAQTKKIKKLAKLLKRTLAKPSETHNAEQDIRRVSKMSIILTLRYRDRISGSVETTEVSGEYTGPLVDGKAHGPGMLRFESGDLYLGEFMDGGLSGNGSYVRQRPLRDGDNLCLSGIFANNELILPNSPSNSSVTPV